MGCGVRFGPTMEGYIMCCALLARAVKVQPIAVRRAQALAEVKKAQKRLRAGMAVPIQINGLLLPMGHRRKHY